VEFLSNFQNVNPPAQTQIPPNKDFLATVLLSDNEVSHNLM